MTAVSKIQRLLTPPVRAARLISQDLSTIPAAGASAEALRSLESKLQRPLSAQHRDLLMTWNGLDLDVIRIFGVPPVVKGIYDLLEWQELVPEGEGNIAFGGDPSGFLYFESKSGSVLSSDHDGGETKVVASCINEFIDEVVFGARGDSFLGEEWLNELRALGLS
ncbi:MAG: SMI1/KNR4 family protein [Usitatibacter sp.]